jgi:hypothetical protein
MDTTINNELPNCLNEQELILFKEESDVLQTKFIALSKLGMFDKLAVNKSNNLFIQKISPWRYVVRKIKNQNRSALSNYLNIEMSKYNDYIRKIYNIYYNQKENQVLHSILLEHYILLTAIDVSIKNLRDKYNLNENSKDISMSLENSYNIIAKLKSLILELITPK